MAPSTTLPLAFTRAVEVLQSIRARPEISVEEIKAPERLAPFAYALSGTVVRGGDDVATGRLILLHDPAGHAAWEGTHRLVTYITAELESEMATDTLLPTVGWSWLVDALDAHGAHHVALGGTVTQIISTRFGELADHPTTCDVEIRASWTPALDGLAAHGEAWLALLALTAGLPPPGVATIGPR
jgi:DUF3000 family protein